MKLAKRAAGFGKLLREIRKTPGFVYVTVLVAIFGLLGPAKPFEPYDWFQQSFTAQINSKPYAGDAILVEIDEQTLKQLDSVAINRSQLATIIENINKASPKQLIIDAQYFGIDNQDGYARLKQALEGSPTRPVMYVDLAMKNIEELRDRPIDEVEISVPTPDNEGQGSSILDAAIPATTISFASPTGAPISIPFTIREKDVVYPSIAQLMADFDQPFGDVYPVDLSYDPGSIPAISAADVYADNFDPAKLAGKRVVVSSNYNLLRDTKNTPQDPFVSESRVSVIAAQTLIDGPPRMLGWLPSFVIAVLASFALLFLQSPYGRITAILAFLAIMLSPIILERYLIFQNTSTAVFLLIFVGFGRLWSKFRSVLMAYRSVAETKSRFLTQASHDLRQPIHAIGMLAARLGQTKLTPSQEALVAKINWSVEGAGRMFQSLLDIAKIESGTLKPKPAPVSVNELLAEIDGQNAMAAEMAGVTLRFVPSELILHTDRVLALTILQNLVSNAIKYATGKKVLIGCRRRGNTASLCVYDKGKGISQEDLKHVSEEFYRTRDGSSVVPDGTGLGLAIVQQLSELMGQEFSIRSVPNKGTGVVISGFPLTDEPPRAAVVSNATDLKPLQGMRVVVADDDVETLNATEALLEQWGCSVSAFDEFPEDPIDCDLVLSDFEFKMGKTLADHSADLDHFIERGAAIVVVSGHHPDEIERTLKSRATMVLAKPARPAELRSVLMAVKMDGR